MEIKAFKEISWPINEWPLNYSDPWTQEARLKNFLNVNIKKKKENSMLCTTDNAQSKEFIQKSG